MYNHSMLALSRVKIANKNLDVLNLFDTPSYINYTSIVVRGIDYTTQVNTLIKCICSNSAICALRGCSKGVVHRLGEGAFRTVYSLSDDLVIKIAKRPTHAYLKSNAREAIVSAKIYNSSIAQDIKQHFLKVLYISNDGRFLIAEKCSRKEKFKDLCDPDRESRKLWEKFKDYGFGSLSDIRWHNVMWRKDIPVIIDMGNFDLQSVYLGIKNFIEY